MGLRSLFHVRRAVTSLLKRVCHHPCSNFGFELFFSHASPAMPCPIFGHDASRFSPSRGHASDRNRPKLGWMKPKKRPYFSVIAPPIQLPKPLPLIDLKTGPLTRFKRQSSPLALSSRQTRLVRQNVFDPRLTELPERVAVLRFRSPT